MMWQKVLVDLKKKEEARIKKKAAQCGCCVSAAGRECAKHQQLPYEFVHR